jgi:hypothetical protein
MIRRFDCFDSCAVGGVEGAGWMFGHFGAGVGSHLGICGDGAASLPHRIEHFGRLAVVAVIIKNNFVLRLRITDL